MSVEGCMFLVHAIHRRCEEYTHNTLAIHIEYTQNTCDGVYSIEYKNTMYCSCIVYVFLMYFEKCIFVFVYCSRNTENTGNTEYNFFGSVFCVYWVYSSEYTEYTEYSKIHHNTYQNTRKYILDSVSTSILIVKYVAPVYSQH